MKPDQAEQNLQVIRTLMERSTLYRRALGPIMWLAGIVGIGAAVHGWCSFAPNIRPRAFILHWVAASLLVLIGAFLFARREALQDKERFWSAPARRVAHALLAPLVVGFLLTVVFFAHDEGREFLVALWPMLYGCALNAAGFFAPRGLRILGWLFILFGAGWLLALVIAPKWAPGASLHLAMGAIFGGLHLAYGLYLTATKKESNAT